MREAHARRRAHCDDGHQPDVLDGDENGLWRRGDDEGDGDGSEDEGGRVVGGSRGGAVAAVAHTTPVEAHRDGRVSADENDGRNERHDGDVDEGQRVQHEVPVIGVSPAAPSTVGPIGNQIHGPQEVQVERGQNERGRADHYGRARPREQAPRVVRQQDGDQPLERKEDEDPRLEVARCVQRQAVRSTADGAEHERAGAVVTQQPERQHGEQQNGGVDARETHEVYARRGGAHASTRHHRHGQRVADDADDKQDAGRMALDSDRQLHLREFVDGRLVNRGAVRERGWRCGRCV